MQNLKTNEPTNKLQQFSGKNDEMIIVHRKNTNTTLKDKLDKTRQQSQKDTKTLNPILASPQQEMELLSMLIGSWKICGTEFIDPITDCTINGTESYKWSSGGFFISGKWDAVFGSVSYQGISIIGYNESKNSFLLTNYDNAGYVRNYKLRLDGLRWTFTGNRERITLEFAKSGNSFTELREVSLDNVNWKIHCQINAEKVK